MFQYEHVRDMMHGIKRLFCILCMILILIFALIHLGVSISILVKFRHYGDVFRPEKGLAAFNIVIGLYGLLIGGFGLFALLTDRGNLSKIVSFAAVVLALFAFASLITAIVIHFLAITYVGSRFTDHMNNYKNDQDSRNIINRIQTGDNCCGTNTWLDWSRVALSGPTATTLTTTKLPTSTANTAVTTTTTKAAAVTTTSTKAGAATTATTKAATAGVTTRALNGRVIRNIESFADTTESICDEKTADLRLCKNGMKIDNKNLLSSDVIADHFEFKQDSSQQVVRSRRQTQSDYGGIYGLPLTFIVTLPQSCCTNDQSSIDNLGTQYCISNTNANIIHTDGCSKILGNRAVGQTFGLAIINSFLVVIALLAIPELFHTKRSAILSQHGVNNQPGLQYQHQYTDQRYNAPVYHQHHGHTEYHTPAYHQQYAHTEYNAPNHYPEISYSTDYHAY